jgi:uncharacterized membrane protein YeiH
VFLDYLIILDMIGTVAFALSGFILASKANLDLLGISLVTFVTAFGGGIIRDMMVDRIPFVFSETYPITVVFITVLAAFIFKLHNHTKLTNNWIFYLSDSIGLVVFSVTGATIALSAGFNFGGVVLLSLLTAIGGGVIRDMVLNQIPYVFTSEFYGTVAILIGVAMWVLNHFYTIEPLTLNIILVFGLITRLLAIKFKWRLPKVVNK